MRRGLGAIAGVDSEVFLGNALNAVDAKGRLSVPAFIRAQVEREDSRRKLWIGVHESLPCLTVHGNGYHQFLLGEIDETRGAGAADDREDTVFGMTEPMSYDPSGRLSLTNMLRDEAGIADLALFVGRHRYATLWNPYTALERGSDRLKKIAAYRLKERGISA